jgi:hypothetical protein
MPAAARPAVEPVAVVGVAEPVLAPGLELEPELVPVLEPVPEPGPEPEPEPGLGFAPAAVVVAA